MGRTFFLGLLILTMLTGCTKGYECTVTEVCKGNVKDWGSYQSNLDVSIVTYYNNGDSIIIVNCEY